MVDGELQVDSRAGAGLDAGVLTGLGDSSLVDDFVPSGVTDASVTAPLPAASTAGGGEPAKPDVPPDGQTPPGSTSVQPGAQPPPPAKADGLTEIVEAGEKTAGAAADVVKAAGAEAVKVAGGQAPGEAAAATGADPELSPEEQSVVAALDEAERPAAVESFKRGKHFMQFFMDNNTPGEDIRAHMESRSPSRYAVVRDAVLSKSLSDPASFARDYYQRDPQGYGKFIAAVMQGDTSGFFAKQLTGRTDLTPEQIQTALTFYDANKDRVPTDDAAGLLSQDEMDAVTSEFPDLGDKLKATIAAAGAGKALPPDVTARLEKLQKIEDAEKGKKDTGASTAAATAAAEAETLRDAIYDQSYSVVSSYIERRLDDAKDGLGLQVTDQERQSMPDVANLKDIKRHVLLKGFGDLKGFEDGLGYWGEKNEDFMKVGGELGTFSLKGEKQNALLQAGKLIPFADQYLDQRLKHPIVAWLDKQITAAITRGGAAPPLEMLVTGGTTAVPGQATAPSLDKTIDDFEPGR